MKLHTNTKLMMYSIMVSSTMMVISSTNMIMMWFSMELNLFSFILPLINDYTMNEIEASMDYFLSQSLGSMLFLVGSSSIFSFFWLMKMNSLILLVAMAMKLGILPCHHWFPMIMEKISWMNCLILSTWQKIAPLFIMAYSIKPDKTSSIMLSCSNALMGSLMGLSQVSMKKIMAYSSIAHIGWATSSLIMNMPCLSIAYFSLYTMILTPLLIIFNKMNITLLYEPWHKQSCHNTTKISLILMLLSLAGLPPLTGFFPKLLMMTMLLNHSMMTTYILIFSSLLSLFFYMSISLNMMMMTKTNKYAASSKNILNSIVLSMGSMALGMILVIV